MNYTNVSFLGIIPLFFLISITAIPIQDSYAHHDICEICDSPPDPIVYKRISFFLNIDESQSSIANAFLSEVNTKITNSTIRVIDNIPNIEFIDNNSQLLSVSGQIEFQSDVRALTVFNELLVLMTLDRNRIEYGELSLIDSTHHYPNPLPDSVINFNSEGRLQNLDRYEILH